MKKVTLLSIVLILLAVSVVPVMAAGPSKSHGNGNGASAGQGNGNGNQDQTKQQDQDRQQNRNRSSNNSTRSNGNHGNQENSRMRTPFYLQGTISAINTTAKTLTVTVIHGNARVKQFIGTELTLQASDTTMVFKLTQGDETEGTTDGAATTGTTDDEAPANRVPIPFDQLTVGQKVAIHGNLVNDVYTVRLITVYIQAPLSQPTG